jgi:hypothetical protein
MKRYIEIVFDDSGSMASNHCSGKPRHLVAKELFLKSILPTFRNVDDHVVLRLLRETGCNERLKGTSGLYLHEGSLRNSLYWSVFPPKIEDNEME